MRELVDRSLGGSIQIRTDFAGDAWPVRIDAGEFELVMLNLCVNARDAMPNGGTITVRVLNMPAYRADKLSGILLPSPSPTPARACLPKP
jgi:signal transduction histidine kinase